jgi:hypothetical protein
MVAKVSGFAQGRYYLDTKKYAYSTAARMRAIGR